MRFCKGFRTAAVTALGVIAAAASPAAVAAPCGGFTDVDDTNPAYTAFCADVQWVKNRNITLGCTSTTLYCPTLNVTRIQMAAFMKRVGDALTPINLGVAAYTTPLAGPAENLNSSPILCQTADFTIPLLPSPGAPAYPRRAVFNSKVNVFNPTADVELVIDVMYSTAAGAPGSWVSVTGSQTFQTLRAGGTVKDDVSMYPIGFLDLNVGSTYRFGIRIARVVPGGGTGDPYVYCENRVSIANRNGTVAPFDEPERTGRAAQLPPQ